MNMRGSDILLYVSLETNGGHTSDLAWITRWAPLRNLDATWDDWVSVVSSVDEEV
jgi:hypothetical protein